MSTSPALIAPPPPPASGPRWVKWALGVTWLVIVLAAAVLLLLWQARGVVDEFSAGLKAQVVEAATPELQVEPEMPAAVVEAAPDAQVVIAVGSDRRAGEHAKGRSDTMLLVRIDAAGGTVSMLSLPRDLRVPIPGHGTDKLNAAYAAGGMPLLIATVREYLGVKVDHFVQVDFGGFRDVVGRLGGVYLPIDGRYLHRNDGTAANNFSAIDLEPGYQRLTSTRALEFVRFRHGDSDLHRAARQQLFLREVGRQLQARTHDVAALPGLVDAIAGATTSDLSSVSETLTLAQALRRTPPDRINRVVLEGTGAMLGGVSYVVATPAQKRAALAKWSHPGRRVHAQRRRAAKARRTSATRPSTVTLIPNGAGAALADALDGVDACAPTALPAGYGWGQDTPARTYELNGHDAGALWATAGSGRSVLFMFTEWQTPPILDRPSETIRVAGHDVELFYESGRLRMAAWTQGATRAWVTNTLRNELSDRAIIALARSCLRGQELRSPAPAA